MKCIYIFGIYNNLENISDCIMGHLLLVEYRKDHMWIIITSES